MKKTLAVLLALLAVGAGAVVSLRLRNGAPRSGRRQARIVAPAHTAERAPWEPYNYRLRPGPRTTRYNLPALVRVGPGAKPAVRLLLDLQPGEEDYYFVELTTEGTRIGKVESGMERPLGTASAHGLRPGGRNRLMIKRRDNSIAVVLNDALAARAEDEAFHGGRIGWGALDETAHVRLDRVQRCGDIHLGDNFMRTVAEEGAWAHLAGSWSVAKVRNPGMSTNAFYYVGMAPHNGAMATAVRGEWFWDDYRLRVACASQDSEDIGIYFYYRGADNYYLFRWNAERQPGGGRGRKQLIKRWHGTSTVVAEAPGGYQPGVWYELEAAVFGDHIRALIDGHEVFSLTDENLCFGKIGLATRGQARFDDVRVDSILRAFEDDFSTQWAGRWRPLRGQWAQGQVDGRPAQIVTTEEPAKAVAGSRGWPNYTFSATVRLPDGLAETSEAGLVGHYLDETSYALFAWRPAAGAARLEAFVNGERAALEEVVAPKAAPGTRHGLSLSWRRNVLTVGLNGRALARAWVPALPKGKIGLYAAAVEGLAFQSAHVDFPPRPERVPTTNEVHSREATMAAWAGTTSDWESTTDAYHGHGLSVQWHRADFFGDATIEVDIRDPAARPGPRPLSCHLVLSAQGTRSVRSGYSFVVAWPTDPASKTYQALVTRGGRTAAMRSVRLAEPPKHLRFERLGHHLIGSIDNDQVVAFQDPTPLTGSRAAFATCGLSVSLKDVRVYSDAVKVYTFARAPTDWRPAAGTWEITNRWQCDPRWSFFCGMPGYDNPLAALWNKHAFEGNVTVEFAVGPKMERERGSHYQYARDFNVTLCADGRDLRSGYGFLFGGWQNRVTAITRRGQIVARSHYVILHSSSIHRRWFYLKAQKIGSTLRFWIDGQPILSYTDPDPLPGRHVAIWTYGCGIMVARVRISASAIGPNEPPGTPCLPCRTVYDN